MAEQAAQPEVHGAVRSAEKQRNATCRCEYLSQKPELFNMSLKPAYTVFVVADSQTNLLTAV